MYYAIVCKQKSVKSLNLVNILVVVCSTKPQQIELAPWLTVLHMILSGHKNLLKDQ